MKIYTIPGLGFDCRIFRNLELGDHELTYLDWIEPEPEEPFRTYVHRLARPIESTREKTVLIGHSMGGIASLEIAAFKNISQVILISSVRSREEIPFYFKAIGPMALHNFFTKKLMINSFKMWGHTQDYETPEEKALFVSMVGGQTDAYLQWALKRLSHWQPSQLPASTKVFQIHGSHDKTFPIRSIKAPDKVIEHGGHFMVFKHPELISRFILENL